MHRHPFPTRSATGLALLAVLLSCCACSGPRVHAFARHGAETRRVAVLPFRNNTAVPEAARIVTGTVIAGLVEQGRHRVEFPGNVTGFLIRERIIVRQGVPTEAIALMGTRLGVDAVLMGEVEVFSGTDERRPDVIPQVGLCVRLVDAHTGNILYMAHHVRSGHDYVRVLDFGLVRSVGALTRHVVAELLEDMP